MRAKIQEWGNNVGLPVPQAIAQCTHLRAGTEVELTIVNGKLVVTPLSLEQRVVRIEDRNSTVDLNKKWETSLTRRISIAALTFPVVVVVNHYWIAPEKPMRQALMIGGLAVAGYILSTFVLRPIRRVWEEKNGGQVVK